jgi:Glycosyltransferase family 25 (LPS biosynthesis protein)
MSKPLLLALLLVAFFIVILRVSSVYFAWYIRSSVIDTDQAVIDDIIRSTNTTPTPIYYINLPESVERNNMFLSSLDDSMIPMRIDAVSPKTLPKIKKPLKCFTVMDTEYACLSSHIKAIHSAYHNDDQWAIIAEDDAVIKQNIDWGRLIASAPDDWELLQLHTCCIPKNPQNKRSFIRHFHDNANLWLGSNDIVPSAAFYVINRSGMLQLLSRHVVGFEQSNWDNISLDLTSSQVNCQADLLLFNGIQRYICTVPFIDIKKSKSTISWTHNWNDYSHNRAPRS